MLKIYKRTQVKSLKVSSYFLIQGHNLSIGAKLYTHKSATKFKKRSPQNEDPSGRYENYSKLYGYNIEFPRNMKCSPDKKKTHRIKDNVRMMAAVS